MPKSPALLSHYLFSLNTRVLNLGTSHSQKHVSPYTPLPTPVKGISAFEAGSEALRMQSQHEHSVLLCHLQSSKPLEGLFSFRQWPRAEAGTVLAARGGMQQGPLSSPPVWGSSFPFYTVALIITPPQPLEKSHITALIEWETFPIRTVNIATTELQIHAVYHSSFICRA